MYFPSPRNSIGTSSNQVALILATPSKPAGLPQFGDGRHPLASPSLQLWLFWRFMSPTLYQYKLEYEIEGGLHDSGNYRCSGYLCHQHHPHLGKLHHLIHRTKASSWKIFVKKQTFPQKKDKFFMFKANNYM